MDKTLDNIIKKHVILTCLTAVAIVCVMITITYGLYQTNHKNTVDQEIAIGDFDVDLTSNSGQITLVDLNPGDTGNTAYTFTTSNSGDYTVAYNVYLTDNTTTFLSNSSNATTYSGYTQITKENYAYINYSLDGKETKSLSDVYDNTTGKMTIITGRLQPGDLQNHTITFSISSNAPNSLQGSILALNITMDAVASKETGADKILKLVAGSPTNSLDVITKSAPSGATCTNTLGYDGTEDNNLRYVGANPCNYVTFNGETAGWRIVGIMNNVDDGTGNQETRIKLVRNDALGNYSWDTSASNVNSGWGVNDWTQADLKNELNGDYLNTSLNANTNWYNGRNNAQTGVFDYTKRLSATAQSLIGDAKWYLGGIGYYTFNETTGEGTASKFYTAERGTYVCGGENGEYCYDGACPRATEWAGKVALFYPSDYGFAVGGNVRSTCLEKNLDMYIDDNCNKNDWIYLAFTSQWFLTPYSYSNPYIVLGLDNFIGNSDTSDTKGVHPTVYLGSGVIISGGNGTPENPFTLG